MVTQMEDQVEVEDKILVPMDTLVVDLVMGEAVTVIVGHLLAKIAITAQGTPQEDRKTETVKLVMDLEVVEMVEINAERMVSVEEEAMDKMTEAAISINFLIFFLYKFHLPCT